MPCLGAGSPVRMASFGARCANPAPARTWGDIGEGRFVRSLAVGAGFLDGQAAVQASSFLDQGGNCGIELQTCPYT